MKILQNRLRFSVGVQYKPLTVMRRLVGAGSVRAACGQSAGDELPTTGNELLEREQGQVARNRRLPGRRCVNESGVLLAQTSGH